MKITHCDWCGKPPPEYYTWEIFGFDCCGNEFCQAFLTIKAGYENWEKPYSALIPNRKQILEAYGILNDY